MGISNILNIEDLTVSSNPDNVIANDGLDASLPPAPRLREVIEDVINYQIVSTRGGGYQKYLIKWRGRPLSDRTWITDREFQQLNQDFMRSFMPLTQQGQVFLSQAELIKTSGNL